MALRDLLARAVLSSNAGETKKWLLPLAGRNHCEETLAQPPADIAEVNERSAAGHDDRIQLVSAPFSLRACSMRARRSSLVMGNAGLSSIAKRRLPCRAAAFRASFCALAGSTAAPAAMVPSCI